MSNSESNIGNDGITYYSHYIFGYGSLLCPISRAVTVPAMKHRVATPVKVQHLQRMWSFPVVECGMTFMGVKHFENAECFGVLVPIVNNDELSLLDAREWGYERVRVAHEHVHAIPHLQHYGTYFTRIKQQHNKNRNVDDDASQSQSSSLPNVWVYVQTAPAPIQVECPIAQSYVDIILRGALSISPDFAKDVILSTRGWHAQDDIILLQESENLNQEEKGEEQKESSPSSETTASTTTLTVFWVNDRHDPIYVRADVDYSQTHGHEIDALLQQHRPEYYSHRRSHYGKKKNLTM
jgi:hypothetical protein